MGSLCWCLWIRIIIVALLWVCIVLWNIIIICIYIQKSTLFYKIHSHNNFVLRKRKWNLLEAWWKSFGTLKASFYKLLWATTMGYSSYLQQNQLPTTNLWGLREVVRTVIRQIIVYSIFVLIWSSTLEWDFGEEHFTILNKCDCYDYHFW